LAAGDFDKRRGKNQCYQKKGLRFCHFHTVLAWRVGEADELASC
jgi:hypothetical protein